MKPCLRMWLMTVLGRLAVTVRQSLTKSGGSFGRFIVWPPVKRVALRGVWDSDAGCEAGLSVQARGKGIQWSLHFYRVEWLATSGPPPTPPNADSDASAIAVRGPCRQSARRS